MSSERLSVLVVAANASARWAGEAILPLHIFRGLLKARHDAWMCVGNETKAELDELLGADAQRVSDTIARFDKSRHADLWSGIGLACAYAGAYTERELTVFCSAADSYRAQLAQGAAFAAKARLRAGNLVSHTETACKVICGTSALEAAEVTDAALKNLPRDGSEPAFEVWRRRIQQEFTTVWR